MTFSLRHVRKPTRKLTFPIQNVRKPIGKFTFPAQNVGKPIGNHYFQYPKAHQDFGKWWTRPKPIISFINLFTELQIS